MAHAKSYLLTSIGKKTKGELVQGMELIMDFIQFSNANGFMMNPKAFFNLLAISLVNAFAIVCWYSILDNHQCAIQHQVLVHMYPWNRWDTMPCTLCSSKSNLLFMPL
ncbi:hypothetical protein CKAN_00876800 [Cinnamomum micranthum f. kanehirae]|uniref:Uncharacterized protein n=1 Tax=Cinnamomum micranthum f. kanehirae TaxID=337451 RepID=A0A3S3N3L2_9MAGN|nr:hypothetical protein CKAN_00876800 [Cinnamomum micranthum f. kanehirae]